FSKAMTLLIISITLRPTASQTCGIQKSTDPLNLQAQFPNATTTTTYPTSTSKAYKPQNKYGNYGQNANRYMQQQPGSRDQITGSSQYQNKNAGSNHYHQS